MNAQMNGAWKLDSHKDIVVSCFGGPIFVCIKSDNTMIPDVVLDAMIQRYDCFSRCHIYFRDRISHPNISFYDHMIGHPRLDEFMKIEVNGIFNTIKERTTDPAVYEKFKEAILAKSHEESGLGDVFEEFMHFANNRKSARSI